MKQKRYGWIAFALALVACAESRSWAENPFREGVEPTRLSPEERSGLMEYAETSKARLEKALDEARGKSLEQAGAVYLEAVKSVVIASFKLRPRSELLMRHSLNQALELTYGVPATEAGDGTELVGLLPGAKHIDLTTVILEDSIRNALSYYRDDRTAIESGNLLGLPFVKFATDRLKLGRLWLSAVDDPELQYRFSVKLLAHWMNTAANEQQPEKARFAEELLLVDDALGSNKVTSRPLSRAELGTKIRKLRFVLRKLESQLNAKADPAPQTGDTIRERGTMRELGDRTYEEINGKVPMRPPTLSASVEECDPGKVAKAASSYMCRAGSVMWKVESDTYAGKRVYRDMKSGLKVTEPLDGKSNQYNAASRCKDGYRLPTGYPSSQSGERGFANRDSDFVALESSDVRQVVPGMRDHWFWSSSVYPDGSDGAYAFSGYSGLIGKGNRDDDVGSVVCVAGGERSGTPRAGDTNPGNSEYRGGLFTFSG